jgi:hypothetical protein
VHRHAWVLVPKHLSSLGAYECINAAVAIEVANSRKSNTGWVWIVHHPVLERDLRLRQGKDTLLGLNLGNIRDEDRQNIKMSIVNFLNVVLCINRPQIEDIDNQQVIYRR